MINQSSIDSVRKAITKNQLAQNDYGKFSADYIKTMDELSVKYRNVRWLPLDVPKFEFDNLNEFLELWQKECIDILRVKPCSAEPWTKDSHPLGKYSNYYKAQFRGLHFYTRNLESLDADDKGIWTLKYLEHKMFQKIIDQMIEYLPFKEILYAKILESVRPVYPHRDQTYFWNCPTEFRIMLNDDNSEPTLYVADIEHGDAHFIDIRNLDTNAICWSNGSQIHGSNYKGNSKHLVVIHGMLDPEKLESLVDRSIAKYKNKLNYNLEI